MKVSGNALLRKPGSWGDVGSLQVRALCMLHSALSPGPFLFLVGPSHLPHGHAEEEEEKGCGGWRREGEEWRPGLEIGAGKVWLPCRPQVLGRPGA